MSNTPAAVRRSPCSSSLFHSIAPLLLEHHDDDIVRRLAHVEELMRRVLRHVERRPRLYPAGGLLTADHHLQIGGRYLDGDLVVRDDLQRLTEARRHGEPLNPD